MVCLDWRKRVYLALAVAAVGMGVPGAFAQQRTTKSAEGMAVCCAGNGAEKGGGAAAEAKRRFAESAEKIVEGPAGAKAAWGILVVDGETGATLYEKNADRYFVPASNMKLFATALALERLGKGYRFHTTLETRGTLTKQGRLRGDLALVGRGDPNLSGRKFPFAREAEFDGPPERALVDLAEQLKERGVREIDGNIVGDDSYFPRARYPSGWEVDDMVWSYGAAVLALAVNDNTVTMTVQPGERAGEAARIVVEPATGDFTVRNGVVTAGAETKAALRLVREPGARWVELQGTVPARGAARKMTLAVEEPAEQAAEMMRRVLEERGIRVRGAARVRHEAGEEKEEAYVLAEHVSVPLGEAVAAVNKMSENLHTELLLRTAARQAGLWREFSDVAKYAGEFYAQAGIAAGDVMQSDASGLSRKDLVTPRAIVALLRFAARQAWFGAYYDSLPVAGVDGTLGERMKSSPAAGKIHAKTGTVEHVRALSGFAEVGGGKRVIFSFLTNNQGGRNGEAAAALDGLAEAVVEAFGESAVAAR
ncbi:MAG: D-alanyl-D-alanine carboxypeptidase/D-alanyl-D-alanine-endopeptidase [Acidobacteriia bacterium]|nr:D-alanyl-D-alanine carboxypeptidase/D-alanyl-D-alanine-endopeptidase [Terriglobia bacterium]